ncbi:hypothetical protein GCM10017750_49910 [Streptomyces racemochromogenes]
MADGQEAAYDGVRAVRDAGEDGADHGVHPGRLQGVDAGAQGGQGAGEEHPAGSGGVHA